MQKLRRLVRAGSLLFTCGVLAALSAQSLVAQRADAVKASGPKVFSDLSSFYASLPDVQPFRLDRNSGTWLAAMPLACLSHPHNHPNTPPYLWEVSYTPIPDLENQRAFYGCSDWHSAVNSAWTLVRLMKEVPDLPTIPLIKQKLNEHFGASNMLGDLEFFKQAGNFEMPYGYAWLLRVQYEAKSWKDTTAQRWAKNIEPLATWMSQQLIAYLNGLEQPVRTGVHPNTAMAMDNALDYALAFDPALEKAIRDNAERLFRKDPRCRTELEPGMSDFASPCLMEAAIMSRLMPRVEYLPWLDAFLSPIHSPEFRPLTQPLGPEFVESPTAIAARSHIIALAFVRAYNMGEIANALPADDPRVPVLRRLAAMQTQKGMQVIGAVGYDGSHYYASWATTYLITIPKSR